MIIFSFEPVSFSASPPDERIGLLIRSTRKPFLLSPQLKVMDAHRRSLCTKLWLIMNEETNMCACGCGCGLQILHLCPSLFLFFKLFVDKSAHTLTRTPTPPPKTASLQRSIHDPVPMWLPANKHLRTIGVLPNYDTSWNNIKLKKEIKWSINLLPVEWMPISIFLRDRMILRSFYTGTFILQPLTFSCCRSFSWWTQVAPRTCDHIITGPLSDIPVNPEFEDLWASRFKKK